MVWELDGPTPTLKISKTLKVMGSNFPLAALAPHVWRRQANRSITTPQAPQSLATVLVRTLVGSWRQCRGDLHPLLKFQPTRLAGGAFYITPRGLGSRSSPRWDRHHSAFEFDSTPYEGHDIARLDLP
jgi:hypothetical protein